MEKEERESSRDIPRLLLIDALLADGKCHSIKELEELTGKAEATVKRDIKSLKYDMNAPIEYDTFGNGYHYTDSVYRIPATLICGKDMAAYGIICKMVVRYQKTPLWQPLRDMLDAIESPIDNSSSTFTPGEPDIQLAADELPVGNWYEDRIILADQPEVKVDDHDWSIILAALMHNTKIEFDYIRNYDNTLTHRVVEPWQLVFDNRDWYIFGFCELRNERRIFMLDNIKNIRAVNEHFTLPPDNEYKLEKRSIGRFGVSVCGRPRKYRILLKDAGFISARQEWAEDWQSEPYKGPLTPSEHAAVVTFTSNQDTAIMRWILSHGEDAVPLEPPEAVSEWKKHIAAMAKLAAL